MVLLLAVQMANSAGVVTLLADYHRTTWGAQQGAPGEIGALTQTMDGWLWIGTPRGLFRFDGIRFERYTSSTGPQLHTAGISQLWATDSGDLWIAYAGGGMSVLHDGRLQHIPGPTDAARVTGTDTLAVDRDGTIWMASSSGVLQYVAGKWQGIGAASVLPDQYADALFTDRHGDLWASNRKHIYRLDRRSGEFIDSGVEGTVVNVAESLNGSLWAGRGTTWRRLPGSRKGGMPPLSVPRQQSGRQFGIFDRDGTLWQLRCPIGVCHSTGPPATGAASLDLAGTASDHLEQAWQMGDRGAQIMLEDREGNIWIGGQAGLERLRRKKLVAAKLPPGETHFQIASDELGQVWGATTPHASVLKGSANATWIVDHHRVALAIGTATDGSLLLADADRIERRHAGGSTYVALPAGLDGKPVKDNLPQVVCGNDASLWVGISFRGLFHRVNGRWVDTRAYGIVPAGLRAAVSGRTGDVWLGNKVGGILHVEQGGRFVHMPESGAGPITMLDVTASLIAGGELGLAFWADGQFHLIHAAEADVLRNISGMLVDAEGGRWFNGARGVVYVRKADWAAVLAHAGTALRYTLLDASDGYPGAAQTFRIGPTALRSHDGRMWFVGTGGVVSIDPTLIRRNELPPPVVVTGLHTERSVHSATPGLSLPAGTSALRISYTALTYVMPERVRFDYKLDGVDTHWIAAGNARVASYSRLGPGNYRFHVRATNEEGIVSSTDAIAAFSIAPAFTQTLWYKLLIFTAAAVLLFGVHAWWLHRMARFYKSQMSIRLAERERIARELHDTLLQSVQGLILKVHGTSQRMQSQDPLRAMLDDALDQAETTIADGRRRVQDLRTHEDACPLVPLLQALGDACALEHGNAFLLVVEGKQRLLLPGVGAEVLAICREAIGNAFRHARASHVSVTMQFGPTQLRVTIGDDGIGIPDAVVEQGGRMGHFGLTGMRERARHVRGTLTVGRGPAGGTECTLDVPHAPSPGNKGKHRR